MTRKHKFKHIEQNEQNVLLTQCIFCKKNFKSRSGLWYHEKKCKNANDKIKSTKQEISNEECIEIIIFNTTKKSVKKKKYDFTYLFCYFFFFFDIFSYCYKI